MTTLYEFEKESEKILFDFYNDRALGKQLSITEDELKAQIAKLRFEFILSLIKKTKTVNRPRKITEEVVSALVNLGFTKRDVTKAISSVSQDEIDFYEVFKQASRILKGL